MRLQILSDLHTEFAGSGVCKHIKEDAETVVLAGDISSVDRLEDPLTRMCRKFKDVIYVPGNHEYYRSSPIEFHAVLDNIADRLDNLHVLLNNEETIGGVRFYGGTMWFDKGHMRSTEEMMNDFLVIKGFKPWVYANHDDFQHRLNSLCSYKHVVITHHAPSEQSIHPLYKGDMLNHYFMSPLLDRMEECRKPQAWIHGHVHKPFDYMHGSTRVVCNPVGYPGENVEYQSKVIEVL